MTDNFFYKSLAGSVQRGFTLLEILVALAILALVALTLGRQTGQSMIQADTLSFKTKALWLIEDRMTTLSREPWPGIGRTIINLPENDLQIVTDVAVTSDEDFRRITVTVQLSNGPVGQGREILSMNAFKGR